jgi:hypothetical protein
MRDGNVLRRHLRAAALKLNMDIKNMALAENILCNLDGRSGSKPEGRPGATASFSHRHHHGNLCEVRSRISAASGCNVTDGS